MYETIAKGLWKALKSGIMAAAIWTCVFSAILWFLSKPAIPYFNFVSTLAPYSLALFGVAALVFEGLTQWIESDVMYERK